MPNTVQSNKFLDTTPLVRDAFDESKSIQLGAIKLGSKSYEVFVIDVDASGVQIPIQNTALNSKTIEKARNLAEIMIQGHNIDPKEIEYIDEEGVHRKNQVLSQHKNVELASDLKDSFFQVLGTTEQEHFQNTPRIIEEQDDPYEEIHHDLENKKIDDALDKIKNLQDLELRKKLKNLLDSEEPKLEELKLKDAKYTLLDDLYTYDSKLRAKIRKNLQQNDQDSENIADDELKEKIHQSPNLLFDARKEISQQTQSSIPIKISLVWNKFIQTLNEAISSCAHSDNGSSVEVDALLDSDFLHIDDGTETKGYNASSNKPRMVLRENTLQTPSSNRRTKSSISRSPSQISLGSSASSFYQTSIQNTSEPKKNTSNNWYVQQDDDENRKNISSDPDEKRNHLDEISSAMSNEYGRIPSSKQKNVSEISGDESISTSSTNSILSLSQVYDTTYTFHERNAFLAKLQEIKNQQIKIDQKEAVQVVINYLKSDAVIEEKSSEEELDTILSRFVLVRDYIKLDNKEVSGDQEDEIREKIEDIQYSLNPFPPKFHKGISIISNNFENSHKNKNLRH